MAHIVAANDARAVGETLGVRPIGRAQQQRRRIYRATGDDDDIAAIAFGAPSRCTTTSDACHRSVGLDALDKGAGQQRDIRMPQGRRDADDLRIRLGLHQARKQQT